MQWRDVSSGLRYVAKCQASMVSFSAFTSRSDIRTTGWSRKWCVVNRLHLCRSSSQAQYDLCREGAHTNSTYFLSNVPHSHSQDENRLTCLADYTKKVM